MSAAKTEREREKECGVCVCDVCGCGRVCGWEGRIHISDTAASPSYLGQLKVFESMSRVSASTGHMATDQAGLQQ